MKEHIGGFFVSKQSKLRLWETWNRSIRSSILSCLFDSRRRCDKILGFFEYSATLHFKACRDLYRANLHFLERHNQSQKLFPQSLWVSGYPAIWVYSHQNQKGTEIIYILLRSNSQFVCLPPSEKKVNVVGCVTKSL